MAYRFWITATALALCLLCVGLFADGKLGLTGLPPRFEELLLCAGSFLLGAMWLTLARPQAASIDRLANAARLYVSLAPIAGLALLGAIFILRDPGSTPHEKQVGALVLLLGGAALMALVTLLFELASGKDVGIESHWGGLGGSLGGWSLSSPIVALLIVLSCLGGIVALVAPPPSANDTKKGAETPTPTLTSTPAVVPSPTATQSRIAGSAPSNANAVPTSQVASPPSPLNSVAASSRPKQ